MFKTIIVSSLLGMSFIALADSNACPNLSGTFGLTDSNHTEWSLIIAESQAVGGIATYRMVLSDVTEGGTGALIYEAAVGHVLQTNDGPATCRAGKLVTFPDCKRSLSFSIDSSNNLFLESAEEPPQNWQRK